MNKRRLLKLADLLEADARKKTGAKFNLRVVASASTAENGVVKLDCGTQACAMGLAALSGAFKRAGLSYTLNQLWADQFSIHTTVNGRKRDYDRAAMAIFDLTLNQANFLFTPDQYPFDMDLTGAKAERFVAKRIRDLVAGKVEA